MSPRLRLLIFRAEDALLRIALYSSVLALVSICAAAVYSEVSGNPSISVTSTATTTTISTTSGYKSIVLKNDSASANELYARVFWCGETAAAATTASPIRLEPGDSITLTHGPTDGGSGYCAYSVVTAAAETATARVVYK